ncbi:hypothetical protein H1R20_g13881, partial [Candolleomyces eurysporus]
MEMDEYKTVKKALWCNGKNLFTLRGPESPYPGTPTVRSRDTLDHMLSFAFGIIAQLILFIADGLLVYRCYLIFIDKRAVYIPVMVIYVICIVISMLELYPTLGFQDEFLAVTGTHVVRAYSPLRGIAETDMLICWFITSLITNILVTTSIISRIFRQLSLAASLTRTA